MIIKGKAISSFKGHGLHLLKLKQEGLPKTATWNDEVEVVCTQNLLAGEDVQAGMREMAVVAAGSKCRDWLYSVSVNPNDRDLTHAEAEEAAGVLLDELGFSDQHQWLMVRHRKNDRSHFHVAINRVDPLTLRAVNLGWNYLKHEVVARKLEQRFQLTPVRGAFTNRRRRADGRLSDERPEQSFSTADAQQSERTKIPLRRVSADLQRAWNRSQNGKSFVEGLEEYGYILAKGDRRDMVVVDWKGGVHSLRRRLKALTATQIRERLKDIRLEDLQKASEEQEELFSLRQPSHNPTLPICNIGPADVVDSDSAAPPIASLK